MARRVVVAPDGTRWTVRRRWVPRLGAETLWGRFHRRFRSTFRGFAQTGEYADPGCLEVFGEGLAAGIAILAIILLVVFVALPLLVAVVDIVIVILLALLGLIARVLFRRPWIVEARADDGRTAVWNVAGWRVSGETEERIADALAATGTVPPGETP